MIYLISYKTCQRYFVLLAEIWRMGANKLNAKPRYSIVSLVDPLFTP